MSSRLLETNPQSTPKTLKMMVALDENEGEPERRAKVLTSLNVGPSKFTTSSTEFPEMVSKYCPPQEGMVAVPVGV
jgi:hypothetical protein